MSIPDLLVPLFHNYEPTSIDLDRHAQMVIRTVLSEGEMDQIFWLLRYYGRTRIAAFVENDAHGLRMLPESTRRLWSLAFWGDPNRFKAEHSDPIAKWRCRRGVPKRKSTA